MRNIFDAEEQLEYPVIEEKKTSSQSSIVGVISGTITLVFIAVVAPVYFHVLLKIVTWSWNLI